MPPPAAFLYNVPFRREPVTITGQNGVKFGVPDSKSLPNKSNIKCESAKNSSYVKGWF